MYKDIARKQQWFDDHREVAKQRTKDWYYTKRNTRQSKYLLDNSKANSRRRGNEFSITEADIVVPEVCPIFGTKFEIGTMSAASVDRIDNNKGYVKGNIQIISRKANTMKNSASPEELLLFAAWILKQYSS